MIDDPVASPAFARWFGRSFCTDDQGRPLRLFHGTAGEFDAFSPAAVGSAHVDLGVGAAFYFTDDRGTAEWYAQDRARQTGLKPVVLEVFLSLQNPLEVDFDGTGIESLEEDLSRAKAEGRDGLICLNYDDGGVSNHYIAFKPAQIKHATENSGAFDPASDRIRA